MRKNHKRLIGAAIGAIAGYWISTSGDSISSALTPTLAIIPNAVTGGATGTTQSLAFAAEGALLGWFAGAWLPG